MNEKADSANPAVTSSAACCDTTCDAQQGTTSDVIHDQAEDVLLSEFAKSLSHPVRVHVIRLLARQNACICAEVVNDLGLPQSTVSQHLKVLHQSGLVHVSDEGRSRRYCVNHDGLRRLRSLIVNL